MPSMRELRIHVLYVSHGDGIVLEIPVGDGDDYVYGVIDCNLYDTVSDFLDEKEIEELAFIASTHPHIDHIRGIEKLLIKYEGKVGAYWDSGFTHGIGSYYDILDYLTKHPKIPVMWMDSGVVVTYGKTTMSILAPPWRLLTDRDHFTNVNNSSIVINVLHGDSRILLAGDAQFGGWAHMRAHHKEELRAHALKVSHHGSKHGTFLEAMEIVDPNYVIISAGKGDDDHPHKYTTESLEEVLKNKTNPDKRLFNTAVHGHVTIKSTGSKTIKIDTTPIDD
ncbi:MAG: ComEC/Rec2 family competence protein [Candidatus Thorarchaeota archaeon]